MDGERFDYLHIRINNTVEEIKRFIEKNGKLKEKDELDTWSTDFDYYNKYPEERYHYKYSDEILKEFKKGVEILKLAGKYEHAIDDLFSGDIGEETFLKRIKS